MNCELSEENKAKIIKTGLYSYKGAPSRGVYERWTHYCRNWSFVPYFYNDGGVSMYDSYYSDIIPMYDSYYSSEDLRCIALTNENFNYFELIFDFDKVKRIQNKDEYEEDKVYSVATDDTGYVVSVCTYWIDKGTKKSKAKLIEKTQRSLSAQEIRLKHIKDKLEELRNGTYLGESVE